jgi:plasmid stabilization system protein ParE
MSRAVRFLPEARQDLIETRQWYDLRQAGFGTVFARAFADAIERMQAQPLSYPAVVGSIRRVILQRFPYAIYFRVETDEIVVLAIHGRQDLGRWRERIPQTTEP